MLSNNVLNNCFKNVERKKVGETLAGIDATTYDDFRFGVSYLYLEQ